LSLGIHRARLDDAKKVGDVRKRAPDSGTGSSLVEGIEMAET
jgi:hypothetical protein